jgi:hypothetical protein
MSELNIQETEFTPKIVTNKEQGMLCIKGKSYPENNSEFYEELLDWLEEYLQDKANKSLIVEFEITYFNSSTSKVFFDIFDILSDAKDSCSIEVNWNYDKYDESSKEIGKDFIEDFEDVKINLIPKEKINYE